VAEGEHVVTGSTDHNDLAPLPLICTALPDTAVILPAWDFASQFSL